MRRSHSESTSTSLAWTIFEGDDFNVPRIDIVFDSAPSSAGDITVTKDSVEGASYDSVVRTVNPVGQSSVSIEGLHGFVNGDKVVVEYANPDSRSVTASASVELPTHIEDIAAANMTWDGGTIQSAGSNYRRYYHVPLTSSDPGASGATWISADASTLSGWKLDSATEELEFETDIHQDWDGISHPVIELTFTVNVDNRSGTASDVVDVKAVTYYKGDGDTSSKTQTITKSVVVGACDQYTQFHTHIEMDPEETDNNILSGDKVDIVISVPATGDVTDITINDAAFYYSTTHVGIESGDV